MSKEKIDFRREHTSLRMILENCDNSCVYMQSNISALRTHLLLIGMRTEVFSVKLEIEHAVKELQKMEWLLDYVGQAGDRAKQCMSMRDENGEVE